MGPDRPHDLEQRGRHLQHGGQQRVDFDAGRERAGAAGRPAAGAVQQHAVFGVFRGFVAVECEFVFAFDYEEVL